MKTEARTKLKQLKTGVHLVCITDAVIIRNDDGTIKETSEEGEVGIAIRFSTGDNQHFDKDYWINGSRHSFFIKMCASAKIDPTNLKFKAEAKGKRLWICIKEVHDIDGDKIVMNELEQPVINYYLFDTIPCLDPNRKPIVKGDPGVDDIASGVFLDYKQIVISKPILDYSGDIIGIAHTTRLTIDKIVEKYPLIEKQISAITNITGVKAKSEKDPFAEEEIETPKQQETKEFIKKAESEIKKMSNDPINWDEP